MIKDYIRFEETEEKCKFANLAFTTINVDMASKEDREKVCKELNMNYENLTNNCKYY